MFKNRWGFNILRPQKNVLRHVKVIICKRIDAEAIRTLGQVSTLPWESQILLIVVLTYILSQKVC